MTIEHVFIGLLSVIVVLQQVWSQWQINKLVNKLMSRDFHSYQATVSPPVQKGFTIQLPVDGEQDRIAELNRSLNM